MKKSVFKLLALLAIFSFVAVACGDDDDSSSESSSSESSSSESSSSESSSSESSRSEATAEEESEEVAESAEAPSESELKKMKKAELVEVADSMGLDTSGTKADIIERITKA